MPKRFAIIKGLAFFAIAVFFFFNSAKAQPSAHLLPPRSVSPWNLLANDSLYRIHQMQFMGDRVLERLPSNANGASPKSFKSLPSGLKSLFQVSAANASGGTATGRTASSVCYILSGRNFLYQDSLVMWTGQPALTRDGNVIVSGEFANYGVLPLKGSGGFCMKTDLQGNVLWAKLYDSAFHVGYDFINYFRCLELRDGSILLAGWTQNRVSGNDDFILTKVSSTGALIWTKTYQSRLWKGFNGSGDYFVFNDLKEDSTTGDLYFVGSHWFSCVAVTKVDASDGHILWSRAHDTFYSDYAFGLVVQNSRLVLFQLGIGSGLNVSHLYVTGINKSSGDSLFNKHHVQTYTGQNTPGIYNTYGVQALNNGHFLLSGPTTGYYEYPAFTGTKDLYHAGVLELDENFNFVKGYGLKNKIESNGYNTKISFFPDGTGVFAMIDFISGFTADAEVCLFRNEKIYHQRKRIQRNEGMPFEPMYLPLTDGGYLNVKLMSDSTKPASAGSRIEYYRVHSSDTASACLGFPDSATSFWYFNYEPGTVLLDSVRRNIFSESRVKTLTSWDFNATPGPACQVVSHCDTLKLKASAPVACPGSGITVTVQKNAACGSIVPLTYDTTWVSGVVRINDSTYSFRFKGAGAGYISGSLLGCRLYQDSIYVQVLPTPAALELGPDRSLCPGNTILLNARKGYASYVWQDGSTDSTYTVTQPGLYYVTTTDACGGVFKDSVNITAAPPVPFSVGPDRTKCNNDTLHLAAPSGFLAYTWSNNYNINSITSQSVVVNPSVDTAYYIKAEKTPGCFAYDTVRITVHHSPPINLGSDKSFCFGDSAIFDAGAGFQTYLWSSGQSNQLIVVKTAGAYSVVGTTAQSCKSFDTAKIVTVYPLPSVSLDKKTALCVGGSKTLNAGNFASYSWSTGQNTATIVVNATGQYAVTVTDANGCKGSDTTAITTINALPAGFLPLDTAVCSYGSVQLKPLASFNRYLWSTGEVAASITVSKPGLYWLEVVDGNTCKGRDTLAVNPKDCIKGFYIPAAFTPNGDGKNDAFYPLLFGKAKAYRFTVYNRWGQAVFQTTELQKGWDGKVAGTPQRSDVFVWTCSYQLEGEAEKTEKGTVTLLR